MPSLATAAIWPTPHRLAPALTLAARHPQTIINKQTPEQQVPEATINKNDVFAIDVVMSTGEGKPKQVDRTATLCMSTPSCGAERARAPSAATGSRTRRPRAQLPGLLSAKHAPCTRAAHGPRPA